MTHYRRLHRSRICAFVVGLASIAVAGCGGTETTSSATTAASAVTAPAATTTQATTTQAAETKPNVCLHPSSTFVKSLRETDVKGVKMTNVWAVQGQGPYPYIVSAYLQIPSVGPVPLLAVWSVTGEMFKTGGGIGQYVNKAAKEGNELGVETPASKAKEAVAEDRIESREAVYCALGEGNEAKGEAATTPEAAEKTLE